MLLLAHNIRSFHNVGAFFRIADAFDVEKIYLTGYTGTPPHKDIAKVALGSEHRVAWEKQDNLQELIGRLKQEGIIIAALETGVVSVPIQTAALRLDQSTTALILGSEVEGVDDEILAMADIVVSIPMIGQKKSLNVSVACGIAVYGLTR
ncbi:TrmH family RNA methyltransferase [Candidatus Uhrbacteria bacterium]|nr:TrmH family RNA methyltransferase [Candidatus Uhrbacteria bacterium]